MDNNVTIKDMISVMEAYENGAEIEVYDRDNVYVEWGTCRNPCWNWDRYVYRVKKVPKVEKVPYRTISEFLEAQSEHGPYVYLNDKLVVIPKGAQELNGEIVITFDIPSYGNINNTKGLMQYQWQDGKGCYNLVTVED